MRLITGQYLRSVPASPFPSMRVSAPPLTLTSRAKLRYLFPYLWAVGIFPTT